VLLDQVLIIQVLENLLANAVKYSPPDSPISIAVRQREDAVEVQVIDHGPGIPPEERERVFEKFHRLERPGSPAGTGLGLAICKGIVEAHHGQIWADGHPDGGTIITFTIPKEQEGEG
jgi:two-component system sensor histidine kinase KdpD